VKNKDAIKRLFKAKIMGKILCKNCLLTHVTECSRREGKMRIKK
jgi:hypothetical protein